MKVNWFSLLFQEGYREMPRGITYYIFLALAICLAFFELWLGSIGNMSPYAYGVMFLTAILPIGFITTRVTKAATSRPSVLDYIFAVLVMAAGLHMVLKMEELLSRIYGVDELTLLDVTSAIIILLSVLELTRRTLGFGFTFLLFLFVGYALYGHFISGQFGHREIFFDHFTEEMIYTSNGVFGSTVQMVATYAFLFIMFGHFFQMAGGGQFIFDLCASFMGKRVGGLAKVAVASAGLFGSISGSPAADVATTGSVNIPMMKKRGYQPVFAGAVEAAAGSGGTILPPIMGSVAFLMAEVTGVAYFEIAKAAVLSALLYYIGIYMQVHFRSHKLNLRGMDDSEIPPLWKTFSRGFYYIIPIFILVWFMLNGHTAPLAACYGIAAMFLFSFVRRSTWITLKKIITIFSEVIYHIVPLTVASAAAGIIEGVLNLTGMAGKFTNLIFTISDGSVLLSLLVAALIIILLGLGMPTTSIYMLSAALVAPALIKIGLPILPAHLFIVFFAALSSITPPMGGAIFTAAGIAHANPIAIGWQACKLAFVGFISPFMFIYNPALLLQGSFTQIAYSFVAAFVGVYAFAAGYEGYIRAKLSMWERIVLVLAGIGMICPSYLFNAIGVILIAAIIIKSRLQVKKAAVFNPSVSEISSSIKL